MAANCKEKVCSLVLFELLEKEYCVSEEFSERNCSTVPVTGSTSFIAWMETLVAKAELTLPQGSGKKRFSNYWCDSLLK